MNLKKMGVPVYTDKNGERYVESADLKLAVDSDLYHRIVTKAGLIRDGTILADWIERNF